jgi:hypothetical protein
MKYKSRLLGVFIVILVIATFIYLNKNESFNQPAVTEITALTEVKAMPEVVEYDKLLKSVGKVFQTNVEDWGDTWAVQIFEVVTEDDKTSHTATFGWYEVNKKTGEIKKN